MRTERISVPRTPRLEREAARWRDAPRPSDIERPGPGQRSVWDFPRPPAVERVIGRVVVEHDGQTIAHAEECLRVLETASPPTYYLPRSSVALGHLVNVEGTSTCEWKGRARFFDVVTKDARSRFAAFDYPSIHDEYAILADHIAFYASRVDRCIVGGELVRPQPGLYYAGWITSELTGPFKGEPGSEGW